MLACIAPPLLTHACNLVSCLPATTGEASVSIPCSKMCLSHRLKQSIINPPRTCAARVTVLLYSVMLVAHLNFCMWILETAFTVSILTRGPSSHGWVAGYEPHSLSTTFVHVHHMYTNGKWLPNSKRIFSIYSVGCEGKSINSLHAYKKKNVKVKVSTCTCVAILC